MRFNVFHTAAVAAFVAGFLALAASVPAQSAPGDPYARYTRPGQCAQAGRRLYMRYWRDKRRDTVVIAPLTDSIPASVLREVRACASRFTVASVAETDLVGLVRLALWTQQPELLHASITRLRTVMQSRSVAERGWTQQLIATSLLGLISYGVAIPPQWDEGRAQLAALDSMGVPAATWRLFAHSQYSRYAYRLGDLSLSHREGVAAFAASKQMTRFDRIDWVGALLEAYGGFTDPTAAISGGPAVMALLDTAEADILPLRATGTFACAVENGAAPEEGTGGATGGAMAAAVSMDPSSGPIDQGGSGNSSAEQSMLRQQISILRQPFMNLGKKTTIMTSEHWFNATDTLPKPTPGVVSLLVAVSADCGATCFDTYAVIRRLYNKYHARGLQVILSGATHGYFKNHVEDDPAGEAEKNRVYFIDYLKMPGIFSINESAFTRKADGRRVNEASRTQMFFFRGRGATIVGKDGIVNLTLSLRPSNEKVVDDRIAALLAEK